MVRHTGTTNPLKIATNEFYSKNFYSECLFFRNNLKKGICVQYLKIYF